MRAGGTMALLMAHVDTYTIRLVGRWRSDAMLRYVHTTAQTFTEGLAARMVQHGDYALIPPAAAFQEGRFFVGGRSRIFFYYVEGGHVKWTLFIHREGGMKMFRAQGFYGLCYFLCNY